MAPIRLRNSPASSQTITLPASQDARMLVRETMRVAAATTLASAPPISTPPPTTPPEQPKAVELRFLPGRELGLVAEADGSRVICLEEIDGKKWKYVAVDGGSARFRRGASVKAISLHSPVAPIDINFC